MTTSQPSYGGQGGRKSAKSRTAEPTCTDVSDWVTTSAVQPTFWDSDSFKFSAIVASWLPTGGATLGGGWGWDVVEQPGPGGDSSPEHYSPL